MKKKNRTDDNQEDKSKKKKTIIILSIFVVILVLLGLIIYYFVNQKDAKRQIDDFKAAVEDRNYSEISKLLSTNSQKISETDAKHFVDYINTDNNKRNFEQNIEQTKVNLDKVQHDSEKGEIKDKNDRPFIKIVKNGKQFFFIDKIVFEPQMYDVYVK
ncbi:TcaA second domain-containing protein [Staphylococcus nepalensis]|uniref:TcaA second domain-containing protein n=1 Tax=Staphylococcus nepalensis TaxID=214473 RepID=UPI00301B03F8